MHLNSSSCERQLSIAQRLLLCCCAAVVGITLGDILPSSYIHTHVHTLLYVKLGALLNRNSQRVFNTFGVVLV